MADVIIYIMHTNIELLSNLPDNVTHLYICVTTLTEFSVSLPNTLIYLNCSNNPLLELIYPDFKINTINKINSFRHLYYSLKFKKQFRQWLWKLREKKAIVEMHPDIIVQMLDNGMDIDDIYSQLIN